MMSQSPGNASASSKLRVVLSHANVCVPILVMGVVSLSSCDPVRTIRHTVTIAVANEQGLPAPNVKVSMKESWESFQSWGGGTPESEKSYYRQRWAGELPWLTDITNAQGNAVITIEKTGLDWTRGNEPSANRNVVSNREHIIKLEGQNAVDEVRLVMKPGASVKGKSYTVTVIDIQEPRYVSTWKKE
jgi:hypothetical protein